MLKHYNRIMALLVAILMIVGTCSTALAESETLLEMMLDPNVGDKPMARLWLPDAGAGYLEEDGTNYLWMAEEMITELYEAGMGGVELTIVSDGSPLFYENAGLYGWGTDAHVRLLKAIVATANSMPDGFIIDITITAHWPVMINTVDPNDEEQQQELLSVYQKLTTDDLEAAIADGELTLDLPNQRTIDYSNKTFQQSPFFYVQRLQGAIIAQVTEVDENGDIVSVELDSLADMDGQQGEVIGAAGVPDTIYDSVTGETVKLEDGMVVEILEDWTSYTIREDLHTMCRDDIEGMDYSSDEDLGNIVAVNEDGSYGDVVYERAAWSYDQEYGNNIMPIFNMDMWEGAETMNDEQYSYYVDAENVVAYLEERGVDISALGNEEGFSVGDYVLVNCYSEGTGQIQSGGDGVLMNPKYYAVDYFNEEGAQAVIDYWNDNMLYWMETEEVAEGYEYAGMDQTLAELLQENAEITGGSSIFEDSIEAHFSFKQWCIDALDEYEEIFGEDLTIYMPIITGLSVTGDDENLAEEIQQNYQLMLGQLYDEEHAQVISEWTDTFGYDYRAQAYSLTGLDVSASAIAVDVPEGDNSTVGDGLRTLRASVNMSDKRYLSMESLTFGYESFLEWTPISQQINSDYSDGVNRVIFHGSPFVRAYDTDYSDNNSSYPGWSWGFMAWNSRQLWWDYADGITDYIASVQALMQNGTNKVEVAVLRDKSESFSFSSSDAYRFIMNEGFAYNIMSEEAFLHEDTVDNAVATNGMIYEEGPAYQVVLIDDNTYTSIELVEKLEQFAEDGVVIIFLGGVPSKVYGSETVENETELINEKLAALLELDNVTQIERIIAEDDEEESEEESTDMGMMMMMGGAAEDLAEETTDAILSFIAEQGVEPYAIYEQEGLQVTVLYDDVDGSYYYYFYNDNGEELTTEVSISGEGTVYEIDPYEREAEQLAGYEEADGRYTFTISLIANEFLIVAVSSDYETFPEPVEDLPSETVVGETMTYNEAWNLVIEDHTPMYTSEEIAADTQVNPSLTTVIEGDLGVVDLVTWDQLDLTDEQLAYFGKESAGRLAGVGYYTKTITLTEDQVGDYAVLSFDKLDETNILRVIINGVEHTSINAVTLELETDELIAGDNEIEIIVGTGGENIAEKSGTTFGGSSETSDDGRPAEADSYGLLGFTITPYTYK